MELLLCGARVVSGSMIIPLKVNAEPPRGSARKPKIVIAATKPIHLTLDFSLVISSLGSGNIRRITFSAIDAGLSLYKTGGVSSTASSLSLSTLPGPEPSPGRV